MAWMTTSLLTDAIENNAPPIASLSMTGFGVGSAMVWGGMSLEGHTNLYRSDNGAQTTIRHQDEILETIVRTCTGAVGPGFLLVSNNGSSQVDRPRGQWSTRSPESSTPSRASSVVLHKPCRTGC